MNKLPHVTPMNRTPESDEVLRRIGRNVVNFQMVEELLKYLTSTSSLHGYPSKWAEILEKQQASVHRKTMGQLTVDLKSKVLLPQSEPQAPEDSTEMWGGFRYIIEADGQFLDLHDQEAQALVSARNDLIHHFLPRWSQAVTGDVEEALAYLDAQEDLTFIMIDRLKGWILSAESGREQLGKFLSSPEGAQTMERAFLQGSRLVAMLGNIANNVKRTDGWSYLTTALNLIRRDAPEELEDLQQRYGHQNLRGILLAAGYFDVQDEDLQNGNHRTLFRINDRYSLQTE